MPKLKTKTKTKTQAKAAKAAPAIKDSQMSEGQRLTKTLDQLKPTIRTILRVLAKGPLDARTLQDQVRARTSSPVEHLLNEMVSAGVLDIYSELRDIHPHPVLVLKLV
jgi:hypothetical protein